MPHRNSPNKPYSLATEHGRAQSIAHSAHGAFLADAVDKCLQDASKLLAEKIDTLIEKEFSALNPVNGSSGDLHAELSIFSQELGIRDHKEFQPLLVAYGEERTSLQGNIDILKNLIEQIKAMIGIEEEQDGLE
jgi:superoxide dismutase